MPDLSPCWLRARSRVFRLVPRLCQTRPDWSRPVGRDWSRPLRQAPKARPECPIPMPSRSVKPAGKPLLTCRCAAGADAPAQSAFCLGARIAKVPPGGDVIAADARSGESAGHFRSSGRRQALQANGSAMVTDAPGVPGQGRPQPGRPSRSACFPVPVAVAPTWPPWGALRRPRATRAGG